MREPDGILCWFPTRGGGRWYLTIDRFRELRSIYGDRGTPSWIRAELVKAKAWLEANPKRRKTNRGMDRFIIGWIGKAAGQRIEQQALAIRVRGRAEPVNIGDILNRQ